MDELGVGIILSIVSAIASSVVGLFAYYIRKRDQLRDKKSEEYEQERLQDVHRLEALEEGVQAILRDRIIQLYSYCDKKHSVAIYESQNMEHMYNAYHGLGGNGLLTSLHKKFLEFPIAGGSINQEDAEPESTE